MSKRATPRAWKRFWELSPGEYFSFGRKQTYCKCRFPYLSATVSYIIPEERIFVAPWKRVRPMTLGEVCNPPKSHSIAGTITGRFNDRSNVGNLGGPSGCQTVGFFPGPVRVIENHAENRDKTHFVGDDCPGGHRNEPITKDSEAWESSGGTTEEQNENNFFEKSNGIKPPEGFRKLRRSEILRKTDERYFAYTPGPGFGRIYTGHAGKPVSYAESSPGIPHIYIRRKNT